MNTEVADLTNQVSPFYNIFSSRCRITGKLVTETPLRIGSGENDHTPLSVDNAVIRDVFNRPFIPGSSFKGVWRSFAEQVLGAWGKSDGGIPCDIFNKPCISVNQGRELKTKYKSDGEKLACQIYDKLCMSCRLFGAQDFASRIRVRDLLLDESTWIGFCEIRPGVSIDRDTRTAMHGRVYEVEAVPAGTTFDFEALVENPSAVQWYNTLLTLSVFVRGEMSLGGCTSRGLGRVSLREVNVVRLSKDNFEDFMEKGWAGLNTQDFGEALREAKLKAGGESYV